MLGYLPFSERRPHITTHAGGRAKFRPMLPEVVAERSVRTNPEVREALRTFIRIVDRNVSRMEDVVWKEVRGGEEGD